MKYYLLLALSCCAVLAACSKSDNAGYNQQYNLSFDKTGNTVSAMAVFKHPSDLSTQMLSNGASVTFNGLSATYSEDGRSYHWNTNALSPGNVFLLNTADGKAIKNEISADEIGDIDFGAVPDTISKGSAFVFSWTGDALRPGETITYSLFDDEKQMVRYATSGHDAVFTAEDMQKVITGEAELSVGRSRQINIKQGYGNSGGTIGVGVSVKRNIVVVN